MIAKANILVVDDTQANLALLCNLLNEEGYSTLPADSGELSLESLEDNIPDLILLDIRMPGLNGFEVCKQIKQKKELADIPIIFLTSVADLNDKLEGFRLGAVDYITKPFQREELLVRLKTHLSLREKELELKKVNEELLLAKNRAEENERKYQLMLANSPDMILIQGEDGNATYLSQHSERITGLPKELMTQDRFPEFIHPDDIESVIEAQTKAYSGDTLINFEYRIFDKTDKIRWLSQTSRPIIVNGKQKGLQSNVRNITAEKSANIELKKAKEKAEKNEQEYKYLSNQFEAILDHIPGLIFFKDMDNNFIRVNKYLAQAHKLEKKDIEGKNIYDIYPEEDAKKYHEDDLKVIKSKKAQIDLVETWVNEGGTKYVSTSKIPFIVENGKTLGIIGIAFDITEKRNAEIQQQERIKELHGLYTFLKEAGTTVNLKDLLAKLTAEIIPQSMQFPDKVFSEISINKYVYTNCKNISKKNDHYLKSNITFKDKKVGELHIGYIDNNIPFIEKYEQNLCNAYAVALGNIIESYNFYEKLVKAKERAEAATEKVKESEKKILNTIINTEEKERNRFSQELHDGLGPMLSTIKMYFQWLATNEDSSKTEIIVNKGESNINEAIETLREISNNISPRTLNRFGLIAATQTFINRLNETSKLDIRLKSNFETRLKPNVEITLYRVITELINNTLKHADANKVNIEIYHNEEQALLTAIYYDNGKGFDVEKTLNLNEGFGIMNMKQRIKTLGGELIINSEKKGVNVKIIINL